MKTDALASITAKHLAAPVPPTLTMEEIQAALSAAYDTGCYGPEATAYFAKQNQKALRAAYLKGYSDARDEAIELAKNAASNFAAALELPDNFGRWKMQIVVDNAESTISTLEHQLRGARVPMHPAGCELKQLHEGARQWAIVVGCPLQHAQDDINAQEWADEANRS